MGGVGVSGQDLMVRRRLSKRRLAALVAVLLAAAVGALPLYAIFVGTPEASSASLDASTPESVLGAPGRVDNDATTQTSDPTEMETLSVTKTKTQASQTTPSSSGDAQETSSNINSLSSPSIKPEVDTSTHAADVDANDAIANAGTAVAGTAKHLSTATPVFATFVSDGFHEFMLNWFEHVSKKLSIDNVIIAALDEKTENLCKSKGIPYHSDADLRYTFDVMATGGQPLHDNTKKVTMQGKAFQQIGALKAAFLLYLLDQGHEVLVSDVDTVWLRDPRPFFHSEAVTQRSDIAVSTDCLSHTYEKKEQGCWHMQFNTGVLWLRPTEITKKFVAEWRDALLTTEHDFEHDQDIFNRLLRVEEDGSRPGFRPLYGVDGVDGLSAQGTSIGNSDTPPPALRLASRGVTLGALPMSLFCGGQVYFVQRLHEKLGVQPLVVHTTYQFSQAQGKRQRLREHGLWLLDTKEYYGGGDERGGSGDKGKDKEKGKHKGFVMVYPSDGPPDELIQSAGVQNHLDSTAWYRLTVRNLFAISKLTGRIPILPKLTCPCDRYWGNVLPTCSIGGSDVQPPYEGCPQDHVMNLPNLERSGVTWREYSFLENEKVKEFNSGLLSKQERVFVELTLQDGEVFGDVSDFDERSVNRVVSLPAFPLDNELLDAIGNAPEQLLILSSGIGSFCGFVTQAHAKAFDDQMQVALEAESHFCGPGAGGTGRSCDIGFDKPRNVGQDNDCDAMRGKATDPHQFRDRYDRIGRHQDSR